MIMNESEFTELCHLAREDAKRRLGRCIGKDRFETRGVALQAITRRLQHDGVHPYRCDYCHAWHVGSTIGGKRWHQSNADRKQAEHQRHV